MSKEQHKVNRSIMMMRWDVEHYTCDGKRTERIWGDPFSLLVFISLCLEHARPEPQMSTRCQLDVLWSQKGSRNLQNTSQVSTTTSRILHTFLKYQDDRHRACLRRYGHVTSYVRVQTGYVWSLCRPWSVLKLKMITVFLRPLMSVLADFPNSTKLQ